MIEKTGVLARGTTRDEWTEADRAQPALGAVRTIEKNWKP